MALGPQMTITTFGCRFVLNDALCEALMIVDSVLWLLLFVELYSVEL